MPLCAIIGYYNINITFTYLERGETEREREREREGGGEKSTTSSSTITTNNRKEVYEDEALQSYILQNGNYDFNAREMAIFSSSLSPLKAVGMKWGLRKSLKVNLFILIHNFSSFLISFFLSFF